ncbi:MAG: ankyrin repeat domain-containing protein [Alphaproteobacteria bacterium]|nr:ankyrin repeat domain-containing protein [Alphaproteobacteria bacterium]
MKKALVIANMLFASATVWGMVPNDVNDRQAGNRGSVFDMSDIHREVEEIGNAETKLKIEDYAEPEKTDNIRLMDALKANEPEKVRIKKVKKIINRHIDKSAVIDLVLAHKNNQKQNKEMPHEQFAQHHKRIFQNSDVVELVNFSDERGVTPVFVAASQNNLEIVSFLVKHGANVNAATKDSLFVLSKKGISYPTEQGTILYNSESMGSVYTAQKGTTPLHIATEFENEALAKYLVDHCADVNAETADGYTPLMMAARHNNRDLFCYLIENGAKVNNKSGAHILLKAILEKDINFVKYLVDLGADINKASEDGYPPLLTALEISSHTLTEFFIRLGAEVKGLKDKNGMTPLLLALRNGCNEEVLNYLIKNGDDINATVDGYTPLLLASKREDENLIRLLVEKGANVNVEKDKGETPLFLAVQSENTPLTLFLLEHGATDVQKKDSWEDSPLSLAREKEQNETDPKKRAEWTKVIDKMKEIIKE